MEQTKTELKPCPFCGSRKNGEDFVSNTGGNIRYRYCGNCSARGPWGKPGEARDKWNTRSEWEEIQPVREALEFSANELVCISDDAETAPVAGCSCWACEHARTARAALALLNHHQP